MSGQSTLDLVQPRKPKNDAGGSWGIGSWVLLISMMVIAAIIGWQLSRQLAAVQPTSGAAPDFTLTTFTDPNDPDDIGETVTLSELEGKVVLLNFWASWCGPCHREAPALQATWEHYQAQGADVVFIGITHADSDPKSVAFMEEYGITYPNGPDMGTRIVDDYHIEGVPETFIIDQNGEVRHFLKQMVDEALIYGLIDPLLAEGTTDS